MSMLQLLNFFQIIDLLKVQKII